MGFGQLSFLFASLKGGPCFGLGIHFVILVRVKFVGFLGFGCFARGGPEVYYYLVFWVLRYSVPIPMGHRPSKFSLNNGGSPSFMEDIP